MGTFNFGFEDGQSETLQISVLGLGIFALAAIILSLLTFFGFVLLKRFRIRKIDGNQFPWFKIEFRQRQKRLAEDIESSSGLRESLLSNDSRLSGLSSSDSSSISTTELTVIRDLISRLRETENGSRPGTPRTSGEHQMSEAAENQENTSQNPRTSMNVEGPDKGAQNLHSMRKDDQGSQDDQCNDTSSLHSIKPVTCLNDSLESEARRRSRPISRSSEYRNSQAAEKPGNGEPSNGQTARSSWTNTALEGTENDAG